MDVLRDEIGADPQLASRLAMWGRRLVGDTLLVARSALHLSGNARDGRRAHRADLHRADRGAHPSDGRARPHGLTGGARRVCC